MEELLRDAAFPFMVGTMIGASSMCGHWLTLQEQPPDAKAMGERLNSIVAWFYEQQEGVKRGK